MQLLSVAGHTVAGGMGRVRYSNMKKEENFKKIRLDYNHVRPIILHLPPQMPVIFFICNISFVSVPAGGPAADMIGLRAGILAREVLFHEAIL